MLTLNQAFAQEILNKFGHVSTSEMFSLNSVTSMVQSDNGMMWFGTRKGLISFDGIELKFHKNKIQNKLPGGYNDINGIVLSKDGNIWMASRGGLAFYNPKLDSFSVIPLYTETAKPSISINALCLIERSDGEIWVGSNNGIYTYSPITKKTSNLRPNSKNKLSSKFINYIYQTKDNTMWLATEKGLNKSISSKNGQYVFKTYYQSANNANSISSNTVNVLLEDDKNNLWIGTQNGLDYLNRKTEKLDHFRSNLTSPIIRSLVFDDHKRLWVGTYDGISVILSSKVVHEIKHDPSSNMSLVDNKIKALYKDKSGSIWIGSYYGGISYWNEKQFGFGLIDEGNGQKLSFKVISSISQDSKGKIYFGTEGEGVTVFDKKTKTYSYIRTLPGGEKVGAVKTLFLRNDIHLFIGTFTDGLIYYNLETKLSRVFKHNPKDEFSLSSNKILSIEENDDHSIWVGTLRDGVNLLDLKSGKSVAMEKIVRMDRSSLNLRIARSLKKVENGDLYIGTPQDIVVLKNQPPGSLAHPRLKRITLNNAGPYEQLNVLDIYEDKNGVIWIGTQSLGLLFIKGGKLYKTAIKGISVYSILQNQNGVIWLSSSVGILRYDILRKTKKVFDFDDGVPPNEFIRASKLFSLDSVIYFGGASGVTTFNPHKLNYVNKLIPNVIITDFKLFDRTVQVGDSTGILVKAIEYTDKIDLEYDQNILKINFAIPSFIKGNTNTYYYRLVGLDKAWTKTTKTSVTYTIQQGGNYQFEVKGTNEDGATTKEITTLQINVDSAPWKTWWAYTIYALLILGVFGIVSFFFRSRLVLQHKLDLEKREFSNLEQLNKHKLEFFTNVSHEFRTPLTLISGPLQRLLEDYKGPHKLFKQLMVIQKNTDQLNKLINELLDFRKFEDSQMKLKATEGNIIEFLREIFLSFSLQAKMEEYSYSFEADNEELLVYFDATKLEKVFYNLLSNSFKHTPKKGAILLAVRKEKEQVVITVQDNGDGMETAELDKIFNQFYEISGQKNYGQFKYSSGIGLAIVKSIVELHKGKVSVVSEEGRGSTFTVSIPLGRVHLLDSDIVEELSDKDVEQYAVGSSKREDFIPDLSEVAELIDGEKQTVLIVEDNVSVAEFLKEVLTDDYTVVIAENGIQGYQAALSRCPSLIISDMMMPEMDGLELCSKIKADVRTSHIPFILLSARTSLVHKYDGLESGADDYLFKPFQVKELLFKCKNILNTHNKLKEKFVNSNIFQPADLPVNTIDETMMNKAFQLVKDNISNEFFSIDEFSSSLGVSRSLLFTKIKAWTNQTPNEFILSIRIKQAAMMIELGNYNISEIGYKVGFKDPSYFSKIFKKHLSVTPKVYSEKFRSGNL